MCFPNESLTTSYLMRKVKVFLTSTRELIDLEEYQIEFTLRRSEEAFDHYLAQIQACSN